MMSGKSFELILTAAAATDKLLVFVGELIRSVPRQQCALFLVDVQRSRNVLCGCVTCIHLTCCVWVFDVDELLCDALQAERVRAAGERRGRAPSGGAIAPLRHVLPHALSHHADLRPRRESSIVSLVIYKQPV